ncbi:type II toxin-antitoxin system RelE/ParE family toxin [Halomonas sp. SpR1]|uniref:type II toxin-antitoxin system RelE family toxin n=1 Tax=Halomonas sp. SpR1 TaxID=3050462 RepID=UPI0027E41D56|nr:type II toxin-antitoxin system RelE/ParE family toxin [Halomonas sp. SpR1]MDQ7731611.1 type II toxin-antitoxin system RelE/ParE family toxin [Halomonas sp. SpR1]
MNEIKWTKKAFKQLRKLPSNQQSAIYSSVSSLEHMPNVQNVKSLKNHQYGYRLRVGPYRVMFDWDGGIKIVQIQEVRKRDDRTY